MAREAAVPARSRRSASGDRQSPERRATAMRERVAARLAERTAGDAGRARRARARRRRRLGRSSRRRATAPRRRARRAPSIAAAALPADRCARRSTLSAPSRSTRPARPRGPRRSRRARSTARARAPARAPASAACASAARSMQRRLARELAQRRAPATRSRRARARPCSPPSPRRSTTSPARLNGAVTMSSRDAHEARPPPTVGVGEDRSAAVGLVVEAHVAAHDGDAERACTPRRCRRWRARTDPSPRAARGCRS